MTLWLSPHSDPDVLTAARDKLVTQKKVTQMKLKEFPQCPLFKDDFVDGCTRLKSIIKFNDRTRDNLRWSAGQAVSRSTGAGRRKDLTDAMG